MAHTSSDLFLLHRHFPLFCSSQTAPISLKATCPYNSPYVLHSFVLQGLRMSTEMPLAQGGFGSLGVFCAVAPWLQLSLSKGRGKVSIELKVTSKFPLSQSVFFLRPFHSHRSCWLSGSLPLLVDPAALSASVSHELTWGCSIALSSVLWGNTDIEISASILLLIWHVDRIGWDTLGYFRSFLDPCCITIFLREDYSKPLHSSCPQKIAFQEDKHFLDLCLYHIW